MVSNRLLLLAVSVIVTSAALAVPALPPMAAIEQYGDGMQTRLLVIDFAAQKRRVIADGAYWHHPSWSRNGRYLVASNSSNLVRFDLATGKRLVLTRSGDCGSPAVSPTTDILWYCRRTSPPQIWRIGLDGRNASRVATVEDINDIPRLTWKPDGTQVSASLLIGASAGCYTGFFQGGREIRGPLPSSGDSSWQGAVVWHPRRPVVLAPCEVGDNETGWLAEVDLNTRAVSNLLRSAYPDRRTGRDFWPSSTRDGHYLAYVDKLQSGSGIHIRTWTAKPQPVVIKAGLDQPAWCPVARLP